MTATGPEMEEVTPSSAFELRDADVVLEAFPDETIAVHLGTGRYYSLDLIAAEALDLLVSGMTLGAVVDHLATRYRVERREVEPTITEFARRLVDEGLVVPSRGTTTDPLPAAPAPDDVAFRAPTLTVYSDMEDLLLLDPIHDVDDTGWPTRADAPHQPRGEREDE